MTLDHSTQRPFRVSKSLRDLIRKPRQQKQQRDLTLPLPSLPDDANAHDYVYDILYECQRGSWMVGYSSKTLLQFDPSPWCDANMEYTPMDTKNYQLPDPTWQWVSKEWMVDMSNDVDEAGWQYSLKFHGAVWHGNYKHFRSFVRRRRWIRLRCRPKDQQSNGHGTIDSPKQDSAKLVDVDDTKSPSSSSTPEHGELIDAIARCRVDRERLVLFEKALSVPDAPTRLLDQAKELLKLFDFEATKCIVLRRLFELRYGSKEPIQLTAQDKQALQSLGFYSDMQSILDTFEKSH